ncbi:MAG: site-2 protease family protein, partial [Mogibacterium sp.]|nr:site-2 protease family protein [Mogibacterium sp.]
MLTAILFILMLLILVIPHELGHFIMAKINHVQVNEFSVGMGPLIYQKQKGETMYSIRLLPLGGYCAMEGEDEESNNPRAFSNKSAVQKISVLLAGVMMNVLIALIIISCVMFKSGVPTNVLASVDVDSPAMQAGLLAGDEIVSIEGQETGNWTDTIVRLSHYDGKDTIEVTVKRDGAIKNFNITPTYDTEREQYVIGIVSAVSKNPLKVIPYSITYTKNLNTAIIKSFVMLFTGKLSKDDVSGPVGMVKLVNETKSYGIET